MKSRETVVVEVNEPNVIKYKMEEPQICLFDFDETVLLTLNKSQFNCSTATLGTPVIIPNKNYEDKHLCLTNESFPKNLTEFDILIINLPSSKKNIDYNKDEHTYTEKTGDSHHYIVSRYPEKLFDPRPLAASILSLSISELLKRKSIVIVFAETDYKINYKLGTVNYNSTTVVQEIEKSIYSFLPFPTVTTRKVGKKIEVVTTIDVMKNILSKYLMEFEYSQIFYHPDDDRDFKKRSSSFHPLLVNSFGEIVSYQQTYRELCLYVFPKCQNPSLFLNELLSSVLPDMHPEIFPELNKFNWLSFSEYQLPQIQTLNDEKKIIDEKFKLEIEVINNKIEAHKKDYTFLFDLLTKSGDALVKATKEYLIWLGFESQKVIIKDEVIDGQLEEDIEIVLDEGWLLIEIKGISGTSKDTDCNQIGKIKYRRAEEKHSFNVFGLYLVNHQRYIPPKVRKNPPFTPQQMKDAMNEKRGLLTSYSLFKLFHWINQGIISKEDGRKSLTKCGLVKFTPSHFTNIGSPTELHHNNEVFIIYLDHQLIKKHEAIIIETDDDYLLAKVESIKIEGVEKDQADQGEVGIRLNMRLKSSSKIWISSK